MVKVFVLVSSVVLSLALVAYLPAQGPPADGPPPPKAKAKGKDAAKKKGGREPGAELSKAYDLLRRLRADEGTAGRPDERLRGWTDRAAQLYRDGLRARERWRSDRRAGVRSGRARSGAGSRPRPQRRSV